jgi:hypothetical protein
MRRSVAALLVISIGLAGCGAIRDSRVNPFNWFGNDRPAPVQTDEETNPLIPQERAGLFSRSRAEANVYRGQPVDVVSTVVVERTPGGAVVRATGVSRFQNTYDVQLTPDNEDGEAENGVLTYRLEAIVPENAIVGGPERVRRVIAGLAMTNKQLEGVRTIRVMGATNGRETSRR